MEGVTVPKGDIHASSSSSLLELAWLVWCFSLTPFSQPPCLSVSSSPPNLAPSKPSLRFLPPTFFNQVPGPLLQ